MNTPTSRAFSGSLVTDTRTSNFFSVPTTCALVTMSPFRSNTTPEPVVLPASISTTDGSAFAMVAS